MHHRVVGANVNISSTTMAHHTMRGLWRAGSPPPAQSTPERSSLRQRVLAARGVSREEQAGATSGLLGQLPEELAEVQLSCRWPLAAPQPAALDVAVLQYEFGPKASFAELCDARHTPLQWRDSGSGGGWRVTARHSGELVDEARGEARQELVVRLDEVCPTGQAQEDDSQALKPGPLLHYTT